MIEKLDIIRDSENCVDAFGDTHNVAGHKVINKINELVDAVNGILDYAPLEMAMKAEPKPAENVQDKFAEQQKWVGKLCRFRHGLGVTPTYGILGEVLPGSVFPYYKKDTDTYWKYCEPVKPDDDIIYKGGDNE